MKRHKLLVLCGVGLSVLASVAGAQRADAVVTIRTPADGTGMYTGRTWDFRFPGGGGVGCAEGVGGPDGRRQAHTDVLTASLGSAGVTHDLGHSGCAEKWLENEVTDLLAGYEDDIVEVVAGQWERGSADSMQQALALEDLLAPLEIGTVPHRDYDLGATLEQPVTLVGSGMGLEWHTQVDLFDPM